LILFVKVCFFSEKNPVKKFIINFEPLIAINKTTVIPKCEQNVDTGSASTQLFITDRADTGADSALKNKLKRNLKAV